MHLLFHFEYIYVSPAAYNIMKHTHAVVRKRDGLVLVTGPIAVSLSYRTASSSRAQRIGVDSLLHIELDQFLNSVS